MAASHNEQKKCVREANTLTGNFVALLESKDGEKQHKKRKAETGSSAAER